MQAELVEGLDECSPMLPQICEGAGYHGLLNAERLGVRRFGHGVSTFYGWRL
jgi:hypothetical protein